MRLFTFRRLFTFLCLFLCLQYNVAQTAQEEAQQMLDFVNEIRADRGIALLILNDKLNMAAFDHSDDMARNDYFSHTGLNGSTFSQRAAAAGYTGSPRGENIAAGNSNVSATFNQWLNSSGHLNNMLNADANEMGIGHASYNGSTYTHYWTQIFGKGSDVLSNDEVAIEKISVYPNPVKDILYITLPNNTQQYLDIKLVSATGKLVYYQSQSLDSKALKIDVSHLSEGIYFLSFQNVIRKIVKY